MSVQGKEKQFRLICHIGCGKTGTSSIQASLKGNSDVLTSHRFAYWGLVLESAPVKLYDWQRSSASEATLTNPSEETTNQVIEVLEKSIVEARDRGIDCAIWSNEWLVGRYQNIIPALQAIKKKNVQIDIVVYVRRYDAWAKSAYVQWGLKHKTYLGRVRGFSRYVRERPLRFSKMLKPWTDAFPDDLILRNFDYTQDIVKDFCSALSLPQDISSIRVNEAPSSEELLVRALYNNFVEGRSTPADFDRAFQARKIDFSLHPTEWLRSLLPSEKDLNEVLQETAEERIAIDHMLERAGQPPLGSDVKPIKEVLVDPEKISAILLQIIFVQNRKLEVLKDKIDEISSVVEVMTRK